MNFQRASIRNAGSMDHTFAIKPVRAQPFSRWSGKDSASRSCRARCSLTSWKESLPFRLIRHSRYKSDSLSGRKKRHPPQQGCLCKLQSRGFKSRHLCFLALVELPGKSSTRNKEVTIQVPQNAAPPLAAGRERRSGGSPQRQGAYEECKPRGVRPFCPPHSPNGWLRRSLLGVMHTPKILPA